MSEDRFNLLRTGPFDGTGIDRIVLRAFILLSLHLPIGPAVAAPTAQSCPAEAVAAVAKHAGVQIDDEAQEIVAASACKVWPYDASLLLSVFAFQTSADDKKLLVVSALDRRSYRVLYSHQEFVEEDPNVKFGAGSLQLDTSRYQLAAHTRAFGVRFDTTGTPPRCADAMYGTTLTLFVPHRGELKKVLSSMPLYDAEADLGCFESNRQELEYRDANLTLSVGTNQTNGWADLVVTAKIARTVTNGWADVKATAKTHPGSDARKKTTVEHATLKYDCHRYRIDRKVPWWLSFWPQ